MRSTLVAISEATKRFPAPEGGLVTALDRVSFDVDDREFITLLGPSGCGKTTLLRTLSGFEELDAGEIVIDGQPMGGVPAHRRPVNTVFQSYALFPHLSVADNIGYGLDVRGCDRARRAREVGAALELVGMTGFERRRPRQLSGGQQQRVALARAIINRPKLLLLDEPLSALDRKLRQTMQLELKGIQHELGIAFVFVTHDQEEALTMSDRIVVLGDGRVHQIGSPTDVYHAPETVFVARFVGESNLFAGRHVRHDAGGAALRTDSGLTLPVADAPAGIAAGERAVALIRPEDFEVSARTDAPSDASSDSRPDGLPDGASALRATVEQVVFVGTDFRVEGRLASGERLTAIVRDPSRDLAASLRPGDPVRFAFRRHAARLLPAPSDGAVETAETGTAGKPSGADASGAASEASGGAFAGR